MSIALYSASGPRAAVARKLRITDQTIRRTRAMAFYRHRLDGLTDGQIAALWCRCRQYINAEINSLSDEARAEVRKSRLRAIRADALLREMELDDAV